jgi:hypothetical protein
MLPGIRAADLRLLHPLPDVARTSEAGHEVGSQMRPLISVNISFVVAQ